ncbi:MULTISPECIES: hypothetical protein [unclassified Rhodococcus (in: high G+C Gram-positive bacteria)]|uniref:hypothetical protein n=1 Tax=unclassified Rhodococcus (in: high G+C Gram-positive bacteria) TaxID=192944 RepID=UPI00163B3AAD|nr:MULTISPECIES: hypothetical protein [unclassified Rhodococcus (in: high G+C Gram-positive bacteria)]MBC2644748.1 hypothetical protein [Rhodococcus sp. 3A]MBC2898343.1 hypothetical protein [Rhodococcus sp. 4CII]
MTSTFVITGVSEQGITKAWRPIDGKPAPELTQHRQHRKIIEADRSTWTTSWPW